MSRPELYIGIMSGTSMDAIDAALVDFSQQPFTTVHATSLPFPADLKKTLQSFTRTGQCQIASLGESDTQLGHLFADCCLTLLSEASVKKNEIIAIGSHGQTIFHQPNGPLPFTMQLGNSSIIAAKTGICTIADFRQKDIALGGQGAPLTPAFHASLFKQYAENQWVLNLGGIANLTFIPGDKTQPVLGFDTGPANTLLDYWFKKHHQSTPYDHQGNWAKQGHIQGDLLARLLADSYFQKKAPKSTGTEYFTPLWLENNLNNEKPQDIQATLCELTAITIASSISPKQGNLWICGGGIYNQYLLSRIAHHCQNMHVLSTETIGIQPQQVECIAFAWLARQTFNKQPGNLPSVTGASQPDLLGNMTYNLNQPI